MRVRLTEECWEFMRIAFKVKEGAERGHTGEPGLVSAASSCYTGRGAEWRGALPQSL